MWSATYKSGHSYQRPSCTLQACSTQTTLRCAGSYTPGESSVTPRHAAAAALRNLLAYFHQALASALKKKLHGCVKVASSTYVSPNRRCLHWHWPTLSFWVDTARFSEQRPWPLECWRAQQDFRCPPTSQPKPHTPPHPPHLHQATHTPHPIPFHTTPLMHPPNPTLTNHHSDTHAPPCTTRAKEKHEAQGSKGTPRLLHAESGKNSPGSAGLQTSRAVPAQ